MLVTLSTSLFIKLILYLFYSECVKLQDPYCAWYEHSGRCASSTEGLQGPVFQNITSGEHYQCPYSEFHD